MKKLRGSAPILAMKNDNEVWLQLQDSAAVEQHLRSAVLDGTPLCTSCGDFQSSASRLSQHQSRCKGGKPGKMRHRTGLGDRDLVECPRCRLQCREGILLALHLEVCEGDAIGANAGVGDAVSTVSIAVTGGSVTSPSATSASCTLSAISGTSGGVGQTGASSSTSRAPAPSPTTSTTSTTPTIETTHEEPVAAANTEAVEHDMDVDDDEAGGDDPIHAELYSSDESESEGEDIDTSSSTDETDDINGDQITARANSSGTDARGAKVNKRKRRRSQYKRSKTPAEGSRARTRVLRSVAEDFVEDKLPLRDMRSLASCMSYVDKKKRFCTYHWRRSSACQSSWGGREG